MEGSDGQPPGPHPHVHILPCPYYTRTVRADSSYSRGERGEDVGGGPLWSPVRCWPCVSRERTAGPWDLLRWWDAPISVDVRNQSRLAVRPIGVKLSWGEQ
jgi:hypothetical protein